MNAFAEKDFKEAFRQVSLTTNVRRIKHLFSVLFYTLKWQKCSWAIYIRRTRLQTRAVNKSMKHMKNLRSTGPPLLQLGALVGLTVVVVVDGGVVGVVGVVVMAMVVVAMVVVVYGVVMTFTPTDT